MRARQLALWVAAVLLAAPLSRAEEPAGAAVRAVAFSPDGRLLATGTEAPGELTLWDLATRKPRWTHREPKAIASLAFAPDGKTLAAACFARDARLLDVATGQITANLGNHAREVRCVAFSPDGKTLATGGNDRAIKLWDVIGKKEKMTLKGHTGLVSTVEFSPSGKLLVSAGQKEVILWDAATGKEKQTFRINGGQVRNAHFAPPGDRWVITGDWFAMVRVWDARTGAMRGMFRNFGEYAEGVFSPLTRTLALSRGFNEILLYEMALREPKAKDLERIRALLARMDDDDYAVREATGKEILKIGFLAEPELRRAAQEAKSAEVRIRARLLRRELFSRPRASLTGHADPVLCMAFSPDGKHLASGGKDGTARVWDVTTGKEVARFVMGPRGVGWSALPRTEPGRDSPRSARGIRVLGPGANAARPPPRGRR